MSHKGVDRRGRYGNKVGNSLRKQERDEPIGEEGAISPRELIRRYQSLAKG